jgi:hypothetical protein
MPQSLKKPPQLKNKAPRLFNLNRTTRVENISVHPAMIDFGFWLGPSAFSRSAGLPV